MTARRPRHTNPMAYYCLPLLALLAMGLFAACAPNPAIIATLTMLPGTATPRPPTPYPSRTPRSPSGTATIDPAKCPPFAYDTSSPEDASLMAGRHYDLKQLPKAFQKPESGALTEGAFTQSGPIYRWVRVEWQGRALYWVDRQVCQDKLNWPHWEVVDALALPRLNGSIGEFETRSCFSGAQKLPNVIAYGMRDPAQSGEQALQVQGAWEIVQNTAGTPVFSAIDTRDVRCTLEE